MNTVNMRLTNRYLRHQLGFNLTELMVVCVVVGMLTMIAYPSFMQSVRKGKRSDAHAAMTRAATNLERFFSTNGTYTTDAAALGLNVDNGAVTSENGYYNISVAAGPTGIASSYVVKVVANPDSGQIHDDGCTEFTINSLGVRTPDPADSKCW